MFPNTGQALEEELEPPPLSPVPVGLATKLEMQLAQVLGLGDQQVVPRLPRNVAACSHGSRCCWRWLARAALEQVAGLPAEHLGLSQMVAGLRDELDFLRRERKARNDDKERAENAEANLAMLQNAHTTVERELHGLRPLQNELIRLQTEAAELRVNNGRLEAQEEAALREVARLKNEQAMAVESGVAAAALRAETLERELTKAQSEEKNRLQELNLCMNQLKQQKTDIEHLQAKITAMQAEKNKLKNKLKAEKLKARMALPAVITS